MLDQKVYTEAQFKWVLKLHGFQFRVEYKKGTENQAADSLSRREDPTGASIFVVQADWIQQFKEKMGDLEYYTTLKEKWDNGLPDTGKYSLLNELLYYKNRVVIDPKSSFVDLMIKEHHDLLQAGHSGVLKTLQRLKKVCYWQGMKSSVKRYVRECEVCQKIKENVSLMQG